MNLYDINNNNINNYYIDNDNSNVIKDINKNINENIMEKLPNYD